jgi:uracil-DNA glycosylase
MMPHTLIELASFDPSWHAILNDGVNTLSQTYQQQLCTPPHAWLPGPDQLFNAFTLPLSKVKYVLLGESPYPRAQSANGYAFWDKAVGSLWSETGLSKSVNRATSLRNFIKMLLVARGNCRDDTSQVAIAQVDKSNFIQENASLFQRLLGEGFLLLNASLVLSDTAVRKESKEWEKFLAHIVQSIYDSNDSVVFILLGNIAKQVHTLPVYHSIKTLSAEHPYNLSFIHNQAVLNFFRPFDLLKA